MEFSERMSFLIASEIRELLKISDQPDIISFGGGLPSPEVFPSEKIKEILNSILSTNPVKALQYSTTEGYTPLRKAIADRINCSLYTSFTTDNILITSGSQQGIDFTGKLFIDKDDIILCESPTYLSAINAFKAYLPKFIEVPTDDDGIIPDELEAILKNAQKSSLLNRIKLIYVIPDFHNPTGRTWTIERRKQFMEIVYKYKLPVIEDSPYSELVFEGDVFPSLKKWDPEELVISLGTFSKVLCPGFRIGWISGNKQIIYKYVLIKQGADLQTSNLTQMCIYEYIDKYGLEEDIELIRAKYKKRRDVMYSSIKKYMSPEVKSTYPKGGMFLWLKAPEYINSRDLLERCLENKVAFVPGGAFFPNGGNENTLRLNFSNMCEERIEEGIRRISDVLNKMIIKATS